MSRLTLLVYGLEQHEQPVFLAAVELPESTYTANSRLSDKQLVTLVRRLEQGPAPLASTCTSYEFRYLLDGVPLGREVWEEGLLRGGGRYVALNENVYLRCLYEDFDACPVIQL